MPDHDSPPLTPEPEKHKFSTESPSEETKPQNDIIQPSRARRHAKLTQELGVDAETQFLNEAILDYYEC